MEMGYIVLSILALIVVLLFLGIKTDATKAAALKRFLAKPAKSLKNFEVFILNSPRCITEITMAYRKIKRKLLIPST